MGIAEILGANSKRLKLRGMGPIFHIGKRWHAIVGDTIALHSHPLKFAGQTLFLIVDHSSWVQELSFLKHQMIEKIRAEFPELRIKDIRFQPGEIPKICKKYESLGQAEKKLSDDEVEFIERAALQIADSDTRELARKSMSKAFSRVR